MFVSCIGAGRVRETKPFLCSSRHELHAYVAPGNRLVIESASSQVLVADANDLEVSVFQTDQTKVGKFFIHTDEFEISHPVCGFFVLERAVMHLRRPRQLLSYRDLQLTMPKPNSLILKLVVMRYCLSPTTDINHFTRLFGRFIDRLRNTKNSPLVPVPAPALSLTENLASSPSPPLHESDISDPHTLTEASIKIAFDDLMKKIARNRMRLLDPYSSIVVARI